MKSTSLQATDLEILDGFGLRDLDAAGCRHFSFEAGETVVREGDPLDWLLMVASGEAKVCQTGADGRTNILSYYVSAGLIGDIELVDGMSLTSSTVKAVTALECVAVSMRAGSEQLQVNATFGAAVCRELARKLLDASRSNARLALCTAEQRLCEYILHAAGSGTFRDQLTDTAASTGMSYRHMMRLLRGLCDDGVLEQGRSGYRVVDVNELARRSGSSRLPA